MPRYKLIIEYDGGAFCGFQRQDGPAHSGHKPSVQQTLEEAIFAFTGEEVRLSAAGRTDAGVHALAQVCHVDVVRQDIPARSFVRAVNAHVRTAAEPGVEAVAVVRASRVLPPFHARFSATARHYTYRLLNRPAPAILETARVWHLSRPLDAEAMQRATDYLVGLHDFSTFRATYCQAASPVRHLTALEVVRVGDEIRINASAPSFLHHQVRNIVGSLVQVGKGRWTPEDLKAALEARSRAAGGPTAPAQGLYFMDVTYGPHEESEVFGAVSSPPWRYGGNSLG